MKIKPCATHHKHSSTWCLYTSQVFNIISFYFITISIISFNSLWVVVYKNVSAHSSIFMHVSLKLFREKYNLILKIYFSALKIIPEEKFTETIMVIYHDPFGG